MSLRLLALLAALLCFCQASAQVPVPALTGRVVDQTGTLSAQQIEQLDARLAAFEREKGAQIAVLLLPTTAPEPIEAFGIRVAEQWQIGRKGVDDGVIVIVAKDDRAARLEVGYGLEGAVPDAVANRVIDEYLVPRFREGDFYGGLSAGIDRVVKLIEGEPLPPPRAAERAPSGQSLQSYLVFFFVLVFAVGGVLRALLGRFGGAVAIGGIAGLAGWLLISSALLAMGIGLVAFVLTLFGGMGAGGRGMYGPGWGHGRGGFGGGFGGGGFGGGGFRGGGGGFGGGGASGRW
jgi:uncharacterized protein